MPYRIRVLLVVGILLTALSLVGLATTLSHPGETNARWQYVLIPMYGVGALCMIGAGIWWLVRFTRQRHDRR